MLVEFPAVATRGRQTSHQHPSTNISHVVYRSAGCTLDNVQPLPSHPSIPPLPSFLRQKKHMCPRIIQTPSATSNLATSRLHSLLSWNSSIVCRLQDTRRPIDDPYISQKLFLSKVRSDQLGTTIHVMHSSAPPKTIFR